MTSPVKRIRWVDAGVAFAIVVVAVGAALVVLRPDKHARAADGVQGVSAAADPTVQLSPGEQQIIRLLPAGYTANSCLRAVNPFANSVASLDCSQGAESNSPAYARFTLYNDLDALTGDFQSTADGMALSPCPEGNTSPGTWSYGSDPGQVAGKIVCGSIEDRPDIAWTRDAALLLSTVNGGPDLNGLYRWWQRYGGMNTQRDNLIELV